MRSKRRPKEEEDEDDSPRKRKKKQSIYERDNLGELPFDIEGDEIWYFIMLIEFENKRRTGKFWLK